MADYENPEVAFNTVAAEVLTEATRLGVIVFGDGSQMIDAIDALNKVAVFAEEQGRTDLDEKMRFVKEAFETDELSHKFSFGIEAILEDGRVRIWWPQ